MQYNPITENKFILTTKKNLSGVLTDFYGNEHFTNYPQTLNDHIYYKPIVKPIAKPIEQIPNKQIKQTANKQIENGFGICIPYNVQIGPLMVPKSICYGIRNDKTCIYDPEGDNIFCPNWTTNNDNVCLTNTDGTEIFCIKSTKDNICFKENSKNETKGMCLVNDSMQNKICLNDSNNNNILCGKGMGDKFCIYTSNNSGICFPYYKPDGTI